MVLLAKIGEHIAVTLNSLATGDIATDITTTIKLIELAKEGLICYSMRDEFVRCTPVGRLWVSSHENWRAGLRGQATGGGRWH
jgi:hypothetical protein